MATVIVPARNAASTLPATLDGFARLELDGGFEVIVVDDGSSDGTAQLAEEHPAVTHVIRRRGGDGVAAARNAGAAIAKGWALAFIDADCVPEPGWLAAGVLALGHADLVQGMIHPEAGKPVGPFDRTLGVVSEYGLYETGNLFVRRELFERVGGFPDVGTGGRRPFGEDTTFSWEARRSGARTAFAQDALVHHAIFPGDLRSYLIEHARRWRFPELIAQVPELREVFLYRRVFLNRSTAAFDAAVLGIAGAAASKSPWPLALALPYA